MNYYLLFDKQKKEDLIFDVNQLGYLDLKKKLFYTDQGYHLIKRIVELQENKLLNKLKIVSEDGKKKLLFDEFIQYLEDNKVKIKTN